MDRARSEIEIVYEILSTCDRDEFMTQNAVFLAGERVLNPVSGALYVRAMLEAGVLEADVQDWRGLQLVRVRTSPAGRDLLERSRDVMVEYRAILDILAAICSWQERYPSTFDEVLDTMGYRRVDERGCYCDCGECDIEEARPVVLEYRIIRAAPGGRLRLDCI